MQGTNKLNVSITLEEDSPVSLLLLTEDGKLIQRIDEELVTKGVEHFAFELSKFDQQTRNVKEVLFLKIITPKNTETKQILLTEK